MGRVRQPGAACRSMECTACLLRRAVGVVPLSLGRRVQSLETVRAETERFSARWKPTEELYHKIQASPGLEVGRLSNQPSNPQRCFR
eukprot:3353793-Prymnesium_polylepis.1